MSFTEAYSEITAKDAMLFMMKKLLKKALLRRTSFPTAQKKAAEAL